MAQKGGNGSAKAGKSSLKSPASLKGKDDSSAKSKRERRVQFDSGDSLEGTIPKSNGTAYKTVSKGGGGKGGKGDKPTGGDKSSKAKAPYLEHSIEQGNHKTSNYLYPRELSSNTKCLMDCEAAEILQKIQDHMVLLSQDPALKLPMGLTYARRGSINPNPVAARKLLEPLKEYGVSDSEVCMIANIQVESVDEVFALVPSLKGKKGKLREPLKTALDELVKLKSSA